NMYKHNSLEKEVDMMEVSKANMLQRKEQELQLAQTAESEQTMQTHLGHVRLLCNLVLDQDSLDNKSVTSTKLAENTNINKKEMQAMMRTKSHEIKSIETPKDSIFDF